MGGGKRGRRTPVPPLRPSTHSTKITLNYTVNPIPPPKKNDPSSISPYNFKRNPQPLFIGTNKLPIYIFIIGMTSHYYLFLQEYTPLPESVHYQNVNSPCLNS